MLRFAHRFLPTFLPAVFLSAFASTSGAGSATTIQDAIDAALPGAIVTIPPGVYDVSGTPLDMRGKALTLRSQAGPETTILDGGNASPIMRCVLSEGPTTRIEGFTFRNGSAQNGGALIILSSSPTIVDCVFQDNAAITQGGGAYVVEIGADPRFERCVFRRNDGGLLGGGGISVSFNAMITMERCLFEDNVGAQGGALREDFILGARYLNCAFVGNEATDEGGGIFLQYGTNTELVQCTVADNLTSPNALAGGVYVGFGDPLIANSILWNNETRDIFNQPGSDPTLERCMLGDAWPGTGSNNTIADPRFVNPANGNYRLHLRSPAIDAGDNTLVPTGLRVDLAGTLRFRDQPSSPDTGVLDTRGPVDLGAYEACYVSRRR